MKKSIKVIAITAGAAAAVGAAVTAICLAAKRKKKYSAIQTCGRNCK